MRFVVCIRIYCKSKGKLVQIAMWNVYVPLRRVTITCSVVCLDSAIGFCQQDISWSTQPMNSAPNYRFNHRRTRNLNSDQRGYHHSRVFNTPWLSCKDVWCQWFVQDTVMPARCINQWNNDADIRCRLYMHARFYLQWFSHWTWKMRLKINPTNKFYRFHCQLCTYTQSYKILCSSASVLYP